MAFRSAESLAARFEQGGRTTPRYINEAIALDREALGLSQSGHQLRALSSTLLAIHLCTRYNQLGEMRDLEEAIVLDREALQLCPQGHPKRSSSLNNLAVHLCTRYKQLGTMQDLGDAIALGREALQLCPEGHPDRSMSLNNLALCLSTSYNQTGAMRDLDEAIVLGREALQLHPQGHPTRSTCLSNLAGDLCTRYKQLGAAQDLDEAVDFDREALRLCPPGHPDRPSTLNNLAIRLSARYSKLRSMQDLEDAIVLGREALELCPRGHPDRSLPLNNLADHLCARCEALGAIQDLDEAIVLDREALSLCPKGHRDRSTSLNNLVVRLCTRYKRLWESCDLEEAIVLGREALELRQQGHPDRAQALGNLAGALSSRCSHRGLATSVDDSASPPPGDLEEIFSLYVQLAGVSHTISLHDLDASRAWIRAAEHYKHPSTLLAYETSLRLLVEHLSLVPTLPQNLGALKKKTSSLAVDAFSACLRNHAPKRAVELLEQGRGVFWNLLTRLRCPLDDVIASGQEGETLANEFSRMASLIRDALNTPAADRHERLCSLNLEVQSVVNAIRELPGFSRFLLPLLFSDIQRVASGGPVIIVNASQHGCDALVIFEDRDPVHIPLSITKRYVRHLSSTLRALTARTKSMDVTNLLGQLLRELWDDVVFPVVRFLQTTHPLKCRIWWCPTAEFCDLPLHAAGPYRKGQPNLATLYVSSYTPTLSALIHARRPRSPGSTDRAKRFVAIGQANARGQSKLLSVSSELATIGQRARGAGATFTQIEGAASSVSRVALALARNDWVHLACHGLADRLEPLRSAFALSDGELTIARLSVEHAEPPSFLPLDAEFAYLSACHTAVGDAESPDEVIHLASAMQFVGFRSVVGTMWAVDDGATDVIVEGFYARSVDARGRLDHERAAWALNGTMRSVDVPLDQRVLYVHIGA